MLSLARSFAADAVALKSEFVRRGLPADFLDDLNNDIAAFETAITRRLQSTEKHITATAGIDDLIDECLNVVRELDPIVRNTFHDEPAVLAAWTSASHVARATGSARKATAPEAAGKSAPVASQ